MINRPLPRRTLLLGSLGALAVPVLAACSPAATKPSTPSPGGPRTLRLPGTDVNFPSPFSYGGGVGYVQASYVYDTLLWKDAGGDYRPWLASDYQRSDDGTRYTFQLREGVTWSDGEPFTADDVVFTFDYLDAHRDQVAPTVISLPAAGVVKQVSALDPLTVEFRLASPDWTFEQFTGAGAVLIMPQHVWEPIKDPGQQSDTALLVGTGPYTLESMEVGTGAYLYTAREDYFLGSPHVTRIEHRPAEDALTALLAGELDQAGGVGPGTGLRPQALQPFTDHDEFTVLDAPDGQIVTALYFNLAEGGALADATFRQACAKAIDRQALVQNLFEGKGVAGNPGLIPPGHPLHTEVEQYAFDRAEAERMLDEAGYRRPAADGPRTDPDGAELAFELLVSQAQQMPPVELVVADLAAIGVQATVVSVDLATFGQRRNAGKTELSVTTFGGTATDEQPDGLGKVYASTARALQRAQGYANDEVDSLLTKQRRILDPAKRTRIASRIQQLVAEDLPVIPLFYPPLTTIVRDAALQGCYYTTGGVGGLVPSINNKALFISGDSTWPA